MWEGARVVTFNITGRPVIGNPPLMRVRVRSVCGSVDVEGEGSTDVDALANISRRLVATGDAIASAARSRAQELHRDSGFNISIVQ